MRPDWDIREVAWPGDPAAALAALAGPQELAWIDGPPLIEQLPAQSLLAVAPLAVVSQVAPEQASFCVCGELRDSDPHAWRLWTRVGRALPRWPGLPFQLSTGWAGFLGYESAGQLERLPQRHRLEVPLPTLRMALFDRGVFLDHPHRRALAICAVGLAEHLNARVEPFDNWLERWPAAARQRGPAVPRRAPRTQWQQTADQYRARVGRALEYIAAGDVYQVNLAQRLTLVGLANPLARFSVLRRAQPAAHAALLRWDDCAVLSASPELFLQLSPDGRVRTSPIKGTRPCTGDRAADVVCERALLDSAKDAAELTMIVDLHRNDLGRVCEYGTVRVEHPRRLERLGSIMHTVADVSGRLRAGCDEFDLLAAAFPAGSVSGVPKIRALEIIDELEPSWRGVYTGAIGALGLDGQMTMNVAIRTVQQRGDIGWLHVGGGIVADSDPHAEYEETLAKARGVLAGLGVVGGSAARPRAALVAGARNHD